MMSVDMRKKWIEWRTIGTVMVAIIIIIIIIMVIAVDTMDTNTALLEIIPALINIRPHRVMVTTVRGIRVLMISNILTRSRKSMMTSKVLVPVGDPLDRLNLPAIEIVQIMQPQLVDAEMTVWHIKTLILLAPP
jgi:hypothetical protein